MSTPGNAPLPASLPDWEAFYRDFRKPGYVPGFEITSKLGGGMSGLVFRARKQSIGKDYAIKFLQVDDAEVRRAVLAELETVKLFAQIDHPNLVSIEDRAEVDGIPFLVMCFAGTETLRDRIRTDGRAPEGEEKRELLHYFLQACRGIGALHEHSLVHFDVKPANVFLKGPVARVGDYGLSKLVTHSRGSLSMGRGTPYYMAPEMLQRRGDHRSDIYSLGVMLYELLCGCVPFRGDSEWEVLRKHEVEAPEFPETLTIVEREVLRRCLQKDPAARFQNVIDLIAALGTTPVASPGPAPAPVRRGVPEATSCLAAEEAAAWPAPSPAPAPQRRRGSFAWLLLLGLIVGSMALFAVGGPRRSAIAAAKSWTSTPVPAPASPTRPRLVLDSAQLLAAKVDQFVADTMRTALAAVQRRMPANLEKLRSGTIALPSDLRDSEELVDTLARAGAFSPGYATRLERYGRSTFLAGVNLLQELDYEDADDCRRAANVQRFLEQATMIQGLDVDDPHGDPSQEQVCRFRATAEAWRKIAEQFAKTDADYRTLLVAKGRQKDSIQIAGERR